MDGDVLMVNGGFSMVALRSANAVAAPGRIVLCPMGQVKRRDGTDFVMDADSVRQIQADLSERGTDVVIDMDHQTLGGQYARSDGVAPAMGWINAVHFEPNVGLVGNVEWTNTGAGLVARKEYRYLSPVLVCRQGQAVQLHSVALTNAPMISNAKPIVNSAGTFGAVPADDRIGIMVNAGRVWDGERILQGLTSRAAFVNDALRQAGRTLLDATESAVCSARGAAPGMASSIDGVARHGVIINAAREWDREPQLQRITSRVSYIKDALRQHCLPLINMSVIAGTKPMSAEERAKSVQQFAEAYLKSDDPAAPEFGMESYVDESLKANLMPGLTAEELADLRSRYGSRPTYEGK